jgi:hypothetical protein
MILKEEVAVKEYGPMNLLIELIAATQGKLNTLLY